MFQHSYGSTELVCKIQDEIQNAPISHTVFRIIDGSIRKAFPHRACNWAGEKQMRR